ncbi:competence protein ComK [Mammaliicoccus sciuri]|uniref:Competence protein ComK n=1 Tax=Sporosarcina newyorkensis TaxID=759851 RepID=A0A1T4XY74_9BACL|nr:competence protein ComK [Sporosarcina newyorkensis]SKA94343.1 competence protein ComK [Sporosarcina newyorkensis]
MKITTDYVVNKGTSVIYPDYTDEGKLQSVVMENSELYKVDQKPTTLIDHNLRYYGSSLRGANESSRLILGNVMMSPVVINELLNLFFFPSKSPYKPDCIWFALYHIQDYIGISKKRTSVRFINGARILVDLSYSSFNSRYEKACKHKKEIEGRTNQLLIYESNRTATYLISKDSRNRNYGVVEE